MRVPVISFRWFGAAAALLVLSGCQNIIGADTLPTSFNSEWICQRAIQVSSPEWVAGSSIHVRTAQQRFLSKQDCALLSGRFNEQQIAAVQGSKSPIASNTVASRPSESSTASEMQSTPDRFICSQAIQINRPIWEISRYSRHYMLEAQSRSLSERQCAQLTGRFSEQQIATVYGQP